MAKTKKSKAKRIKPEDVYVNAVSFRAASMALSLPQPNPVDKIILFWPSVVCEAFALELFIKCLHHIRRRTKVRGHDVEALFGILSKNDKRKVVKYYQEIVQLHPEYQMALKHGIRFDVDSVLLRAKESFIKLRYWHEHNPPSADSSGHISNAGVGSLCDALHRLIDEARPDWPGMALDIPVLLGNLPPPT